MASANIEVMVIVNVPASYASWDRPKQANRQRQVLRWHDYVRSLHKKGNAPWIWGSHQIVDAIDLSEAQSALVAVYSVSSLSEYDALMLRDPLRDCSVYLTIPLQSLKEDAESDIRISEFGTVSGGSQGSIEAQVRSAYRSLFRSPPSFFTRDNLQALHHPSNIHTDLNRRLKPGDPLQLLLYGINPNELIGMWDDTRRAIHYEKVLWWHAYVSEQTKNGRMTHGWSTQDFCTIMAPGSKKAGGVVVLRAQDFKELNSAYQENPLRDEGLFYSILLQPIADQLEADEEKLRLLTSTMTVRKKRRVRRK